MPVYAEEGRSIVVNSQGKDKDLWAARSLVETALLQLTVKTNCERRGWY